MWDCLVWVGVSTITLFSFFADVTLLFFLLYFYTQLVFDINHLADLNRRIVAERFSFVIFPHYISHFLKCHFLSTRHYLVAHTIPQLCSWSVKNKYLLLFSSSPTSIFAICFTYNHIRMVWKSFP